jgi:hypothetical protein
MRRDNVRALLAQQTTVSFCNIRVWTSCQVWFVRHDLPVSSAAGMVQELKQCRVFVRVAAYGPGDEARRGRGCVSLLAVLGGRPGQTASTRKRARAGGIGCGSVSQRKSSKRGRHVQGRTHIHYTGNQTRGGERGSRDHPSEGRLGPSACENC